MKKIILSLLILCSILSSCNKIPEEKFQWEAGISAPKYYPMAGRTDFDGISGYSMNVSFESGWGQPTGGIVSGNKYKSLPTEVYIEYYSIVEAKDFKGTVKLPYDKILALFKKHCSDKENDSAVLLVGLAPGGWIRVWFQASTMFNAYENGIEIAKEKLDSYDSGHFRDLVINDPNWENNYTYWQHFGIPYEAWEENEKKYNLYLNLSKPNPEYNITSQYNSLDGTSYFGNWKDDNKMVGKLPADLILGWISKTDTSSYDTHVLMPKNFTKFVENKKTKKVEIVLEIENNEQIGILYLITNNKKEKILRFKNLVSTSNKAVGDSNFSNQVEYFIK